MSDGRPPGRFVCTLVHCWQRDDPEIEVRAVTSGVVGVRKLVVCSFRIREEGGLKANERAIGSQVYFARNFWGAVVGRWSHGALPAGGRREGRPLGGTRRPLRGPHRGLGGAPAGAGKG
eukprot:7241115-Pyramimonas_sp.AAC.1